jgi:hypothetical protein
MLTSRTSIFCSRTETCFSVGDLILEAKCTRFGRALRICSGNHERFGNISWVLVFV